MTEPKHVTIPLPIIDVKRQEAEEAYAMAVGRVSGAWNYLHQTLGGFFAVVVGGDAELVLAAWRSFENDRAQREMLRATITAASLRVASLRNADHPKVASLLRWKHTPKAPDDLLWVLNRADALSDVRNDAIHALVSMHVGAEIAIGPAFPLRGKRERKLFANAAKGRKLLDDFAKCVQDTDALSVFVRRATFALAEPDRQEWPTPRPDQIWAAPKQ